MLALYSQGFPDLYGGDATTRIQHLTTLANVIIADSGLAMELRLVGTVLVEVDEQDHWARPDAARIAEEVSRHGSDLTVLYRPQAPNAGSCGWSYLGGLQHRGVLSKEEAMRGISTVMGNCSGRTLAHELGHALGLGHSFWQNSTGTWRWSRGHGVDEDFGTVMTYGPKGGGPRLEVFSDPDASCRGRDEVDRPCGEDRDAEAGADAVASLDAVRFQAAAFQDGYPDSDGDGFVDPVDDLPEDATEWHDTDGDGVGNNADTDDDGDGVADGDDVFPLDSAEWADADGDGVGDNGDAFPDDAAEWAVRRRRRGRGQWRRVPGRRGRVGRQRWRRGRRQRRPVPRRPDRVGRHRRRRRRRQCGPRCRRRRRGQRDRPVSARRREVGHRFLCVRLRGGRAEAVAVA